MLTVSNLGAGEPLAVLLADLSDQVAAHDRHSTHSDRSRSSAVDHVEAVSSGQVPRQPHTCDPGSVLFGRDRRGYFFVLSRIQSPMNLRTSGEIVSSMEAYSLGDPVDAGWKR
jgi:hypothetical protein